MLPDLKTLLDYRHEAVIRSYLRNYKSDETTANALFTNMLKYLWISKKHQLDFKNNPNDSALHFSFVMHEEMRDIDNMWHNFILYTRDYMDFCHRFFNEYLHHVPDMSETFIQTQSEFSDDMEKYLSYVFDNLGEETVRNWFGTHL